MKSSTVTSVRWLVFSTPSDMKRASKVLKSAMARKLPMSSEL